MDRSTFTTLCSELSPHIRRKLSRFRVPVTVDEQLAVTLWCLATNIEYITNAALFVTVNEKRDHSAQNVPSSYKRL